MGYGGASQAMHGDGIIVKLYEGLLLLLVYFIGIQTIDSYLRFDLTGRESMYRDYKRVGCSRKRNVAAADGWSKRHV